MRGFFLPWVGMRWGFTGNGNDENHTLKSEPEAFSIFWQGVHLVHMSILS